MKASVQRLAIIPLLAAAVLATGCASTTTKHEAFPLMYTDAQPASVIVIPAINKTTAADAGELLNVTVAQPFSNHGYYVFPVPLVAAIFEREGILDGQQVSGIPPTLFKENFGADAVLFLTIEKWEKNYIVIAGNIAVEIEYVMLSTETSEVLWSYEGTVVVDTSGSSGNILVDIIATAVTTAMAEYVPVARQVHEISAASLPFGHRHPKHRQDGSAKSVVVNAQQGALEND